MNEDSPESKLGKAMKELRQEKGFSQEVLSFETELHRTYISSVERGCRNISLANIIAIAKALGVSASELLKRAGL